MHYGVQGSILPGLGRCRLRTEGDLGLRAEEADDFIVFHRRYLLVVNIPIFCDQKGRILLERRWYLDLVQHLRYLSDLTLAAPRISLSNEDDDLIPIDEALSNGLKLIILPQQTSRIRALVELPRTFWTLWRAVGRTEIVHGGIAGWPYPFGWLAFPIAKLRRKKILLIVESAPWRLSPPVDGTASPYRRTESTIYEWFAKYWCSAADLSFYTQPAYLEQLHANPKTPAYLAPATWINQEDILEESQAESLWRGKLAGPVRFLFAGRLVEEKGIKTLLEAVKSVSSLGVPGEMHVLGDGPLLDLVVATTKLGTFTLTYHEPIPYGPSFLQFLERFHALVVPSLSDEQPRVVYDAAARAVPVIGSDTDGLRSCVENGRTGRLIRPGDHVALAEELASLLRDPKTLRELGLEALSSARTKTHRAMHVHRSEIIAWQFGERRE